MDSERLLAISQLLCPLEGMVDERDRMGIVVGFVRVMTEMMMEKIAFFLNKGLREDGFSLVAIGPWGRWFVEHRICCLFVHTDTKMSKVEVISIDFLCLESHWATIAEPKKVVRRLEDSKKGERYIYTCSCWISWKTLPSFWVKNCTPWDNYQHFSKFLSSPTWLGRPWNPEVSLMSC